MEILGVVPARSGSKGIPDKNIKPLVGKPLMYWMIQAALKSKHITRIIASTDSEEYAAVAKECGAEVPFLRPADISGDRATDVEFLQHTLNQLEEAEGYKPDIILRLPPTAPLTTAAHIDTGIETLLADDTADAVRPIAEAPKHPYKMWKLSKDEKYIEPFLPKDFTKMDEPYNGPRQALPDVYIHTGSMDVMRYDTIMKKNSTSGDKLGYFFMELEDVVNIDHQIEFDIAELLLSRKNA